MSTPMHVVFLAAGRGLRMGSLTETVPKALVALPDGRSILETNLANIGKGSPKSKVAVVGGHCWDAISAFCAGVSGDKRPLAILNEAFETAGPVRSIAAALPHVTDGDHLVVGNGDTIFSAGIFTALCTAPPGVSLVVSPDDNIEGDDMGIVWAKDGSVLRAAKSAAPHRKGHLSAGLLSVRGPEAIGHLHRAIDELSAAEIAQGRFFPWHDLLPILARAGVPARAIMVDRKSWQEFDHAECIAGYAVSS